MKTLLNFIFCFILFSAQAGYSANEAANTNIANIASGFGFGLRAGFVNLTCSHQEEQACAQKAVDDLQTVNLRLEASVTSDSVLTIPPEEAYPPVQTMMADQVCRTLDDIGFKGLIRNCLPNSNSLNTGSLDDLAGMQSIVTKLPILGPSLAPSADYSRVSFGAANGDSLVTLGTIRNGRRSMSQMDGFSMGSDPSGITVTVRPRDSAMSNRREGRISSLDSEISTLFESLDPATRTRKFCDCKAKEMILTEPNQEVLNARIESEKSQIGAILRERFGKNLLNKYASSLEGIGYYAATTPGIFAGMSDLKSLECSDFSKYEDKVSSTCKRTVPADIRQARLKLFLDAFGEPRGANPDEKLLSIAEDAYSIDFNGAREARKPYEQRRKLLGKTNDSVLFAQNLITTFLSSSGLKDRLMSSMNAYKGKLPGHIMGDILYEEFSGNPQAFMDKFLQPSMSSQAFVNEFRQRLNIPREKDESDFSYKARQGSTFNSILLEKIGKAMVLNPTIGLVLSDPQVMTASSGLMPLRPNESLFDRLDADKNIIKNHYQSSCEELQREVADLMCSTDSDLASRLSSDEMLKFSDAKYTPNNMTDFMGCTTGNFISNPMLVRDLSRSEIGSSDYVLARQGNPNPIWATLKEEKVVAVTDTIRRVEPSMIQEYGGRSVMGRATAKYEAEFGASRAIASVPERSVSSTATTTSSSSSSRMRSMDDAPVEFSPMPMMNANPVASNAAADRSAQDLRNEVRNVLSNSGNRSEVERAMSNTDDQSLRELMQLREEASRNREKLLELTSESERSRLRELENKIRDLETKRAQLERTNNAVAAAPVEESPSGRSSGLVSRGDAGRDVAASVQQLENNVASSTFNTAGSRNGAASTSGGSAGAAGVSRSTIGGLNAAIASAVTGQSSDPVIILSGSARTQDIRSQELSQEIVSYLNRTDADLATLQQIKSSGMVYKYRVLENGQYVEKEVVVDYMALDENAKRLIDQKLASKSSPSQLAALNIELQDARRTYSYNTLKLIIGEQLQR